MAAIIFDFDGTIADSRDYFIEFIAREANRLPLSKTELIKLEGLSLKKVAKHLGIVWWRLPGLYFRGRSEMDQVVMQLEPFNGMPSVIKKLHAEGHELFIVSSNSLHNIRTFLQHHSLREYFTEIYGGVEVFGKASMLHRLMRENRLKLKETIAIGDEARDIEAAQSIGMRVLAVTWGFSKKEDIIRLKPTAVAERPEDIVRLFEESI